MEIYLRKVSGNYLIPDDDMSSNVISKIKTGSAIKCNMTKPRNYKFFKKFYALLNVAFDSWDMGEGEYKGNRVQKNFDRFRHDVIVSAGFYTMTYDLNGDFKVKADSISFGSMSEERFEELYSKCVDVILHKVLKNYSHADLDLVVEEIIGFT